MVQSSRRLEISYIVLTGLLAVLVVLSAFFGLTAAPTILRSARSTGQWCATITELLYGVLACVLLAMRLRPSRRLAWTLWAWAAANTATASLAPVVWGKTTVGVGVLSGVVAAALLAGVILARQALWRRVAMRPHAG